MGQGMLLQSTRRLASEVLGQFLHDNVHQGSHAVASLLQGLRSLSQYDASTSACSYTSNIRQYRTWQVYRRDSFPLPEHIDKIVQDQLSKQPGLPTYEAPPLVARPMAAESRRVGCIAVKAGMTQDWDNWGVRVPLTVVDIKYPERNGYWALQLGASFAKQKSIHPGQAGFFLKQGVPFKKDMFEWEVTEDALLPIGTSITAAHFVPGQRVDVTGWTKYKGFQGVMKRWGFKGMPASHGTSKSHRGQGSTGNRSDPGRVWKGKKMAGHMGDERRTVHNCLVYKVDPTRNLLYIRGQLPGPAGNFLYLRDAFNVTTEFRDNWNLPFPTYIGDHTQLPVSVYQSKKDPYRAYQEEVDYFPVKFGKGD